MNLDEIAELISSGDFGLEEDASVNEMRAWAEGLSFQECSAAIEWVEATDGWQYDNDLAVVHSVCTRKYGSLKSLSPKERLQALLDFDRRFSDDQ
jgi:hypothetical protein